MDFFATTAKGAEPALRDELRELRFRGVRADRGGVHFAGPIDEGYRACIELRTAVRVLGELTTFEAGNGDALYEGVGRVDWDFFLSPRHTLAVRTASRDSALSHTQFIAQKTKDAIVDQLRHRFGSRPSVDLDDPDVRLFVHLKKDKAILYADLSGESLHRRGYRTHIGQAPMKEVLAAALLRLSGWDRKRAFVDPMCGSGTLVLEAMLWSLDIAPGLSARHFGFERWRCHDSSCVKRTVEIREAARARIRRQGPPIFASDIDPAAIETTLGNARRAGLTLQTSVMPLKDLKLSISPAHLVTNPPYGERVEGEQAVYREMAETFSRLHGCCVGVISATSQLEKMMPLRPKQWWNVMNGAIECRFLVYEIP